MVLHVLFAYYDVALFIELTNYRQVGFEIFCLFYLFSAYLAHLIHRFLVESLNFYLLVVVGT